MAETQQPTHWKKLVTNEYMGSYSLNIGEERIVKIISVSREKVKGADGKDSECIVAKLENEKPLILNRTNCKTLTKVTGSPYIENWRGERVIVYSTAVKAFGDTVDALRIRPEKPILPELNTASPKWQGAVQALKDKKTTVDLIEKQYKLTKENRELLIIESQK